MDFDKIQGNLMKPLGHFIALRNLTLNNTWFVN